MRSTSSEIAVQATGLTRTFGDVRAVDGVDLTIPRGEVLALLGPNGAGKTTFLDMVLGFSTPTAGSVRVFGQDPAEAVRDGRVGAVLQTGGLLPDLTVAETVDMVAACHRAHLDPAEVMERADLTRIAGRRVKKCSGGEQQRVRFGLALLTDPDLLVLDEPTAGMDVRARRHFWDTMHAEAERGRTIVFATHFLPEAEDFADRIVLMHRGRLHADGTPDELVATAGVHVTATPATDLSPADLARRVGLDADHVVVEGDRLHLTVPADVPTTSDDVARVLLTERLGKDLGITRASLDDVFLALTDADLTKENPA